MLPVQKLRTRNRLSGMHRVLREALPDQEPGEGEDAEPQRQVDRRAGPAEAWTASMSAYTGPPSPRRAEHGAEVVDRDAGLATSSSWPSRRSSTSGHRDRHDVDHERPAPRQESTNRPPRPAPRSWRRWSCRSRCRSPCACAGTAEVRGDEGERARHEQCTGDALHAARDDQELGVRRGRDRERGDAERDQADAHAPGSGRRRRSPNRPPGSASPA